MQLGFNTRLLWVGLAAVAWAYLGIAAALAQLGDGPGGPRAGLHLRLPRGAVELPGKLLEASETADGLHIVLLVRDARDGVARGTDGARVKDLPPGVSVEFVTAAERKLAAGERLRPSISTLRGQDRPLRLPGGREVIVGERFNLHLTREGVALIPHDGDGMRLLEGPLRRRGWGEREAGRPEHGPGGPPQHPRLGPDGDERGGQERQRDEWRQRRENRGEGRRGPGGHRLEDGGDGPGAGQGGLDGDHGRPKPPTGGDHHPPPDGDRPPPRDDGRQPPRDEERRPPPPG